MSSYQRVCGIDVAKDTLQVHIATPDGAKCFLTSNDDSGYARIIEACRKHQVQIAVMEATGGYQRPLAIALASANVLVAVINPSRVRHYALSEGVMAKSDKVDARIIASFALKIAPKATTLRSKTQEQMVALTRRKGQLRDCKVAEDNRLQQTADAFVVKAIKRHLAFIKREIEKIDKQLEQMVESDPELQAKAEAADSLKGIGRATAVGLLTVLPELGTLNRRQIAKLAGLAPFDNESGQKKKERHIQGGRPAARTLLYMCAVSALHGGGMLREYYDRLIAHGKCAMEAITAVMRKMLVIINARARDAIRALPNKDAGGVAIAAGG